MSLLLDQDQLAFADAVRSVLGKHVDSQRVRAVQDDGSDFDRAAWHALVELGVTALLVPEEHGGIGLGLTEASLASELAGASLAPVPLHTAILGAAAVLATDDEDVKGELLPAIAAGELLVAPAFTEDARAWIPDVPLTRVADDVVTGEKGFVRDGQFADRLLVLANGTDGTELVLVDSGADGIERVPLRVLDRSVFAARVDFTAAPARRIRVDDIGAFLDRVDSAASILLAAAQYGAYRRALEITTQYAKDRYQFGRSIGSFQGVKHPLAEWATEAELAYSLLRNATAATDSAAETARVDALAAQVKLQSLAFAGGSWMVRLHGGIGYTWEHDAHLYLKQAKTSQLLLGTPGNRREKLAEELLRSVRTSR